MASPLFPKYVSGFAEILWNSAQDYALLCGYKKLTKKLPISELAKLFSAIESVIPDAASAENQLADKAYVDFGVEQMAAKYLAYDTQGNPFPSYAEFAKGKFYYNGVLVQPTKNDYVLINGDERHDGAITRYWYTGSSWSFQYIVNNTPLNEQQLAALNSAITAAKVTAYDSHLQNGNIHTTQQEKESWNAKYDKPNSGIPKSDLDQETKTALDNAANAYKKPSTGIPSTDMTEAVQQSLTKADNSVQQVEGKDLSTNDFTNEAKNKLNGIEAGAQVNETLAHDDYVSLSKVGDTTTIGLSVHTSTYDV